MFGADTLLSKGPTLIGKLLEFRRTRRDGEALLRLLYIEVSKNLGILKAVLLEKRESEGGPRDEALLCIAPLLDTDVLEQILLPTLGSHAAYDRLRSVPIPLRTEDDDLAPITGRLHSLLVRVTTLQRLADVPALEVLRQIRVRQRLNNIRDDYVILVKALAPFAQPPLGFVRRWLIGRRLKALSRELAQRPKRGRSVPQRSAAAAMLAASLTASLSGSAPPPLALQRAHHESHEPVIGPALTLLSPSVEWGDREPSDPRARSAGTR